MTKATIAGSALLIAGLLGGCGTTSLGPNGSKHQTMNGVSGSNYPAGQPKDPESPALSSSSEQAYSRPGPKVPK